MIHPLRRIGFPRFKRTRRSSRRPLARLTQRLHVSEPLEARVLLAADVLPALQSPIEPLDVDGSDSAVSLDALAILSALSRGGDELLAHAGVTAMPARSAVSATPESSAPDLNADPPVVSDEGVLDPISLPAEGEAAEIPIRIGDGVFVVYDPDTGGLRVQSELDVTTLEIISASGIFTGDDGANLGGTFDQDTDTKIFKLDAAGFRNVSFGDVAQTGLSSNFVNDDLTISGSHLSPPGWPAGRDRRLSNKEVSVRLQVINLDSQAISQIAVGEDFYIRALVQDVRPTSLTPVGDAGVYAAYLDVVFDSVLADPASNVQYASLYSNAKAGTFMEGLLDEVGATSNSFSPLDTTERELFRVRMTATAGGDLTFDADAADNSPQHDVLVYGGTAAVDELDIQYIDSQTVEILDTPAEPDLVAFAKAIADTGAEFYGAFWCSACHAQQELFEDGQEFLPYIESSTPDRRQTPEAAEAQITVYPTWVLPGDTRLEGVQSLETLAAELGIEIPDSNQPFLQPIEDVTLLSGSPLNIPLDGYDPNGGPLTYTITSDNPTLVSTIVPQGNRSMRIQVQSYGEMVFQLFEDMAPRPAQRVIELAQDGFYDGLTFHRILNDFVIQGGDPDGTGSGSSDLPDFDDQFHVDLQHNRTGILSYAKSADDTNNSQFFITEGSSRHLDFNHSIFGQLIEGEPIRDNVSNTQASNGVPTIPVVMQSVEIFQDTENSLVMLKAPEGTAGSANITVTVADQDGHEYTETFAVTVQTDALNGGPFLDDIPVITTTVGQPVEFQLTGQDVEGDPILFSGINGSNVTLDVNPDTGEVTATPAAGFLGVATATVRAAATLGSNTQDTYDSQLISILVLPNSPVVGLLPGSDSGISDSDLITNLTSLQFEISNVVDGASVELFADESKIGEGTADGDTITITTANLSALGDGDYEIVAVQTVDGETSEDSAALTVTLDQTAPGDFLSTPPSSGLTGELLEYDADHPDEGLAGFRYSLSGAPTEATIDPSTGEFSWTPSSTAAGPYSFGIVATDAAGNPTTQAVDLDIVQQELLRFRLQAVDLNGDPIDAVASGESFEIQVLVEDVRDEALGVFAAYVDVMYDLDHAQLDGSISYGSSFSNVQLGSTATAGLIDETGATAGEDRLGAGEFLLFSIPLVAQTAGQADFSANPADDLPIHDSLLHGINEPLRTDQMIFEGTSLEIVSTTFAQDDEFDLLEDNTDVRVFVLGNDIAIPDTAILTITDVGDPSHGTAQVVSTDQGQAIEYTPDANFVGEDSFTYMIQDDSGNTSTATVTATVVSVNDLPSALQDEFTVAEDSGATDLNVLNNDDTFPDEGEILTIESVSDPVHGTVAIVNDGTALRYTPDVNYNGSDTFSYTVSDGNGGTAEAVVEVTVTEVNDLPSADDDIATIDEDASLELNVSDLLANDTAGGGETGQSLSVISVDGASVGTVSLEGSTVTFTPPGDFFGTATFNYTVQDDGTTNGLDEPQSSVGTVTVTVSPVNDDPTAVNDDTLAQTGGSSILVDVLSNDLTTPDEDETLSVASVGAATNGTARLTEDGEVEYTPADDFSGTDSFTYTISDGNGGADTATVTVTVLNFVPGGVNGIVFYDYNDDGIWQSTDQALSGARIILTGIDAQGAQFNQTAMSDRSGNYSFRELTPGTYTVTQEPLAFTVDGRDYSTAEGVQSATKNSFTVELTADGLGDATLNFAERRLDPKFALWEALASTSPTGFYAAVDEEGGRVWTRQDEGWEDVAIVDVVFSQDMSELTITVEDDGQLLSATVPRSDHSNVQLIGSEDGCRLIRFNGAQSAYDFQPVAAGDAEGESARDQVFAEGEW